MLAIEQNMMTPTSMEIESVSTAKFKIRIAAKILGIFMCLFSYHLSAFDLCNKDSISTLIVNSKNDTFFFKEIHELLFDDFKTLREVSYSNSIRDVSRVIPISCEEIEIGSIYYSFIPGDSIRSAEILIYDLRFLINDREILYKLKLKEPWKKGDSPQSVKLDSIIYQYETTLSHFSIPKVQSKLENGNGTFVQTNSFGHSRISYYENGLETGRTVELNSFGDTLEICDWYDSSKSIYYRLRFSRNDWAKKPKNRPDRLFYDIDTNNSQSVKGSRYFFYEGILYEILQFDKYGSTTFNEREVRRMFRFKRSIRGLSEVEILRKFPPLSFQAKTLTNPQTP